MKVKFKISVAGINFHHSGGNVYDLPSDDANYWVREGLADFVDEDDEVKEETRPLIVQEIKKTRKRPVNR